MIAAPTANGQGADLALAADRMRILVETFDVYVRDHPGVLADLDLTDSATAAACALIDLVEKIHARDETSASSARLADRMRILTETFDLYVREEPLVGARLRLSVQAFILNFALQTFTRRLTATLANAPMEATT